MTVWTHELLDALRQIGDPALEAGDSDAQAWRAIPVRRPKGDASDPALLQTWRLSPTGARPPDGAKGYNDSYWTYEGRPVDAGQLEIAHSLFAVYGGEIGASLLLASLPNAYAAAMGAEVLASTGELASHAQRRIGETAQLVVDVLSADSQRIGELRSLGAAPTHALPAGGRGHVRVRTTRLTHAVIRELLLNRAPDKPPWDADASGRVPARPETKVGLPINQEDLLGTLGTFTVTTLEVMEKLGVPWNDEAEHAYLMLWDRVGELLGIGTKGVTDRLHAQHRGHFDLGAHEGALRPKSVAEARDLQELIRDRVWPLPTRGMRLGPFDNANGKVLVRALLDELQAAMPRGLVRLPLVVMRYLVHESAHELLGLGGGGIPDSVMRWSSVERFARGGKSPVISDVVERTMRLAANDISRRAFIHFIRERATDASQADFVFPGVTFEHTVISDGRGATNP